MSAENGTPLDALETGDVANTADASRMANILRDMNASGADVVSSSPPPPPPPPMGQTMQPMPPMQPMNHPLPPMMQAQHPPPQYIPVDDDQGAYAPVLKKNIWSRVLDSIADPLFVGILVLVLSLPALHTVLGKYASWAYVLGGQLSWVGLLVKSLLAAVLFGLYRTLSDYLSS